MLQVVLLSKKNLTSKLAKSLAGAAPESNPAAFQRSQDLLTLETVEGPQDFLPRIQQSYWTSVRATGWVIGLRKL